MSEYSSNGEGGQYETPPEYDYDDSDEASMMIDDSGERQQRLDRLELLEQYKKSPEKKSIIKSWKEEYKRNLENTKRHANKNIEAAMQTERIQTALKKNMKNLDAENKQMLRSVLQSSLAKSLKNSDKFHSVEHEIIKIGEENKLKKKWCNILLCQIFNEKFLKGSGFKLGEPNKRDNNFSEFFQKLVYDESSEEDQELFFQNKINFFDLLDKMKGPSKIYIKSQLFAYEFNYADLYKYLGNKDNEHINAIINKSNKTFTKQELVRELLYNKCVSSSISTILESNLDPLYRSLKGFKGNWINDWKERKSITLGERTQELNITPDTQNFQKFVRKKLKEQGNNMVIAENEIIATSREQQEMNILYNFEKHYNPKYFYIGTVDYKSREEILYEIKYWLIVFVNFHVFIKDPSINGKEDIIFQKCLRLFTSDQIERILNSLFHDKNFEEVYINIFIEEFLQYKLEYYGGVPLNKTKIDILYDKFYTVLTNFDGIEKQNPDELSEEEIKWENEQQLNYFDFDYVIKMISERTIYEKLSEKLNEVLYDNLPLFFDEYNNPIAKGVKRGKFAGGNKNVFDDYEEQQLTSTVSEYARGTKFRSSIYKQLFGNKISREVEYWVPKLHMMTGVPVFNEVEKVYRVKEKGAKVYLKLNFIELVDKDNKKESKLYYFRKFIDFYDFLKEWQRTFWNKMNSTIQEEEKRFFSKKVKDIQKYFLEEKKNIELKRIRKGIDNINIKKLREYAKDIKNLNNNK